MNLTKECKNAKKIGISAHIRPDGDAVGSTTALYLYLKKMMPKTEVSMFLETPAETFAVISCFDEIDSTFASDMECDVFFMLDCGRDRLGDAKKYFTSAKKTINIDHHISNENGSGDVNYVVPNASSTCELIYELIAADKNGLSMEEKLDKDIALALYLGMVHDTGVFQYSNTSKRTMEIAGDLISYGIPFYKLIEETFYQKSYVQSQIMGRSLLESIRFMNDRCIVSCVDKKVMDFYEVASKDMDGIVNQLKNIKGIDCAVFMYQTGNMEYKVSLRSSDAVDVSVIASYFGGGGHMRAAGCTMSGTFHDVVNNLALHIEQQFEKQQEMLRNEGNNERNY